jgi:iron complex outermembrane receptor protein
MLTATLRFDGSSRFGENNKYGTFPSVSGGWRISEEGFLSGFDALHNLKLRVGWGQTGNQEVPSKQTLASVYSGTGSGTGYALTNGTLTPGIVFSRNANPDLKWEVVTQTNVGLDFGFWGGKLYGSIDYFNKVTTDPLLEVNVTDPLETGGGTKTWKNLKDTKITNKGFEIELGYQGKVGEIGYSVGANASTLKNKIKNLQGIYYAGSLQGPGMTSDNVLVYMDGESIGSFYLPEFKRIDSNGLSVYAGADGTEKYASEITTDDYKIVGSALPDYTYSFFGSLDYKNFDFSFNFNGVSGNKLYNNTSNAYFRRPFLDGGNNVAKKLLDDYPGESATNSDKPSTRYLEDGSFLRLNNVTLGYNYNKFKSQYISNIRLYVTGQNLFVLTDYSGYDPEVNTNKSSSGLTSYGIDLSSYPKARTFLFGINVSF